MIPYISDHKNYLAAAASGMSGIFHEFGAGSRALFSARTESSARISQPRRNSADRRRNRAVHLRRIFAGALAPQHIHLDQMHRVHIRIAQLDRPRQHLVALKQLRLPRNRQHRAHGAMELGLEHVVDAFAQLRILHQRRVEPRRRQDPPCPAPSPRCASGR